MRLFRGPRLVLRQLASRRTKHLLVGVLIVGAFFYPTFLLHWPYSWELIYKLDNFYAENPGVVVTVLTGLTVFLVNYADRLTTQTQQAERNFEELYSEFVALHEECILESDFSVAKLTYEDVMVLEKLLIITKFIIYNDVSYKDLVRQFGARYVQMYRFYTALNENDATFTEVWMAINTVEELIRQDEFIDIVESVIRKP